MLQVAGGHIQAEYMQESDEGSTEQPAHRQHLQYLSDLLSLATIEYADQVSGYTHLHPDLL